MKERPAARIRRENRRQSSGFCPGDSRSRAGPSAHISMTRVSCIGLSGLITDSSAPSALTALFTSIPRPRRLSPAAAGLKSFQRFAPLFAHSPIRRVAKRRLLAPRFQLLAPFFRPQAQLQRSVSTAILTNLLASNFGCRDNAWLLVFPHPHVGSITRTRAHVRLG
jgi:hypothetical protein